MAGTGRAQSKRTPNDTLIKVLAVLLLLGAQQLSSSAIVFAQGHHTLHPDTRFQKPISEISCWGIPVVTRIGAMTMKGVYLSYVRTDGRAGKSGFRHGDIIVQVNGIEIADTERLKYVLKKLEGGILQIDILRDNGTRYE